MRTIPRLLFPLAPWCHLEWGSRESFSFQTVQEIKMGGEGREEAVMGHLWQVVSSISGMQWWNLTSGRGFCRKNACYGEWRNKQWWNSQVWCKYDASMMQVRCKYDASMMQVWCKYDVSMMQDLVCMHSCILDSLTQGASNLASFLSGKWVDGWSPARKKCTQPNFC